MAKSKSSTKVTARRTAAKGSRKGPAEPAAAVADNPPAAPATDRARGTKQALVLGLLQRKQGRASQSSSRPPAGFPTRPGRR